MPDPLRDFWVMAARRFSQEHQQVACRDIASKLEDDYGSITIGCMMALDYGRGMSSSYPHLSDTDLMSDEDGTRDGDNGYLHRRACV